MPAQAAIYQCLDEQGNAVFSDLGCPGRQVMKLPDIQILDFTPSAGNAPARRSRSKQGSSKRRQDPARPGADPGWQRRQACEQARQVLQQIRRKRRQGYGIAEASRLDAQANAAKRDRQRYCH